MRKELGERAFGEALARLLPDEEIGGVPELAEIPQNPQIFMNPLLVFAADSVRWAVLGGAPGPV